LPKNIFSIEGGFIDDLLDIRQLPLEEGGV